MSLFLKCFGFSSRHKVSKRASRRKTYQNGYDLRFPIEIWEIVIDFLAQLAPPLFPLLTLHSALHRGFERVLYRHINLSGDRLYHLNRRVALFKRIANHPHIALLVQSFDLPSLIAQAGSLGNMDAGRYYLALHDALCAMTNLQSLTLRELTTTQIWAGVPFRLDNLFTGCKRRIPGLFAGWENTGFCTRKYGQEKQYC